MHDGQRAIRWVRSQAGAFHVDPDKIGVMGFSAGGHLAATLETHYDVGNPEASDPVDRISCRPDFAILVYPVVTMKADETHMGSRDNLLGPNPDPALVANLSNETQVTPPNSADCPFSPRRMIPPCRCRTVVTCIAALQKAGVASELHIYPHGGHGFGYGQEPANPKGWFDVDLYAWLKKMGFAP